MTQLERSGEQQPGKHTKQEENRGIAIQATPLPDAGVVFQKAPDGGLRIAFQGNITIDVPPAMSGAAEAVVSNTADVGYRLIPDGTPPLAEPAAPSQHGQSDEREIITRHITFAPTTASLGSTADGTSADAVATKDLAPYIPNTVEKVVTFFTPYTGAEAAQSIVSASETPVNGLFGTRQR